MSTVLDLNHYRDSNSEVTAFGLLCDIVHSPVFSKEVGYNSFCSEEGNRVYVHSWSVLGQTYHAADKSYTLLLMVDVFSGVRSKRKVMTVEVKINPPSMWASGEVNDRVVGFVRDLHKGSVAAKVGGYLLLFGKDNEVAVVDYSVKAAMVRKLLEDEEKFDLIENRILYRQDQLKAYIDSSLDVEKVNGYNVYRFRLVTGKYLGVTAGCAWIGRFGQEADKVNVIYDLSKMTMAEARKRVKQSYQHKHITDMLYWFIQFGDMRKKMPTGSGISQEVG